MSFTIHSHLFSSFLPCLLSARCRNHAALDDIANTATDSQQDVPIILVGNKCDEEENRKIKTEVAQDYVSKVFKKCGFIETSAKTNQNVQEAFQVMDSRTVLEPQT